MGILLVALGLIPVPVLSRIASAQAANPLQEVKMELSLLSESPLLTAKVEKVDKAVIDPSLEWLKNPLLSIVEVCSGHGTWTNDQGGRCNCDPGYAWPSNSVKDQCVLISISCGVNAHQEGISCVCDANYEGDPTTGCTLIPLTCGTNAHQAGTSCVCDTGFEGDPVTACTLVTLTCGTNAHQEGTACVCDTGYVGDPTVSCSLVLTCGTNAHQEGASCVCDAG